MLHIFENVRYKVHEHMIQRILQAKHMLQHMCQKLHMFEYHITGKVPDSGSGYALQDRPIFQWSGCRELDRISAGIGFA